MTAVDLTAAADVLDRAADLIEQRLSALGIRVGLGRWHVRTGTGDGAGHVFAARTNSYHEVAGTYPPVSDWIAVFDPAAMAELAPALRMAAELAGLGYHPADGDDPRAAGMLIALLHTVARRVLREEADAPAGTVTVEAAGRLVDVPALPLAHGQAEAQAEGDGGAGRFATGVVPADAVWDRVQLAFDAAELSLTAEPEAKVPRPIRDGISALGELLGVWHGYGESEATDWDER